LFENLRYIVIDELHSYRGVFGSHLCNLLRRLQRIAKFYGSEPQFVCCSATIANPGELAERLIEDEVEVLSANGAPAAEINGDTIPGVSSGQAIATMESLARQVLPSNMGFEWTDLAYQQISAGNVAVFVFPLCVLLVFLMLAALYENWSMPLAVVLIVPMCLLCAITGVSLRGMDNNILTQVGFVVLVGLACKNAILIVAFARAAQESGQDRVSAVIEACRLRLRRSSRPPSPLSWVGAAPDR
jgi:multidrug efflux pump subunit AcrB